ncbi:MAG: hypothetical protein Q4P78_04555 [Rothia sp. (in: high G+C Gram-positive bacteria)]|uniref:hypothetical protein n=1 Tax=Rothia sp. (in: high G+C Gram-positive bacteria) TaxID=1885016 RepID=UPI0026E10D0F|nr:hypothetical protein [Rothia sp. (in: high G+C Gram-positive bacteria)]MDO5750461.1 hypothetical protein [Rothia sp. (in: high G+C Gram-positive bacteria)]
MKKILGFIFVFIISTCFSCASPPLPRDTSAKAVLDYKNNTIIMPISNYFDYGDKNYYYHAQYILMKRCFERSGSHYDAEIFDPAISGSQGQGHGVWNPEYTQKYGYIDRKTIRETHNDSSIEESCRPQVDRELAAIGTLHYHIAATRVEGQARQEASRIKEWQDARKEWHACMKSKNLTPPASNQSQWMSQEGTAFGGSKEVTDEEIRVATIEAKCAQETGSTQKMMDIEASIQAPLIRDHEADLKHESELYRENNKKFKEFVLNNQ